MSNWLVAEGVCAGLALIIVLVRCLIVFPIRVSGNSMLSTLHDGDFLVAWHTRHYRRKDIVICHYPGRWMIRWGKLRLRRQCFVKRIIGLPGETVEIVNGEVYVSGSRIRERYLDPDHTRFKTRMRPRKLGPDEYFVLGDNRDSSNDSRRIGPIKANMLVGRVGSVFYPLEHRKDLGEGT